MAFRPERLDDFVGQEKAKELLRMSIIASKQAHKPMAHTLFFGPPGLGKTTLANVVANELGVAFHVANGAAISSLDDIERLLASLTPGGHDILFIDEIHALPKRIEEALYPVIEEFTYYVVDPKNGREVYSVEPFTLIGATTNTGLISKPLRDRFGIQLYLNPYDVVDLAKIIIIHMAKDGFTIETDAALELASRSRSTARVAVQLSERLREYALTRGVTKDINIPMVHALCDLLEIDEMGLTPLDRRYIRFLYDLNRPVGLKALASMMGEDVETIEQVIEPYLIEQGLVVRTERGRVLTEKAVELYCAPTYAEMVPAHEADCTTARSG